MDLQEILIFFMGKGAAEESYRLQTESKPPLNYKERRKKVMYGSHSASKDPSFDDSAPTPYPSQLLRRRRHHQHQQHQQQEMSSGLARFRSAPSSLLGELCDEFLPLVRPSSPEMETMLEKFLTPDLRGEVQENPPSRRTSQLASPAPQPQAYTAEDGVQQNEGFSSAPQMLLHDQQQQQIPPEHKSVESTYLTDGRVSTSSNLVRHSSSPAGLFSHLNGEDGGYGFVRVMDGFGNGDSSIGGAANRLLGQMSFPSRQNSIMSQVSDMVTKESDYNIGFPVSSWEQTTLLSDNPSLSDFKRSREKEKRIMDGGNSTDLQNGGVRNNVPGITHQMSLPKTSSEMAAMEKYLQFVDTVPWKVRAKRGCATHPRSIAERVRRTKISERMRKLQELVPNMDKQTNTADMLDLAVDYIKDLQEQVEMLNESRGGCTCSASKQQIP